MVFLTINGEPDSYKEIVKSPNKDGWINAVKKEYKKLEKMNVFEWTNALPDRKYLVESQVIYWEKLDKQENHIKYKA